MATPPPSTPALDSPSRPKRVRIPSMKQQEMEEMQAGMKGEAGAGTGAAPTVDGPKYLQPHSFYPLQNSHTPSGSVRRWEEVGEEKWLSPEDDPMATRGIPIFRPTMEEFQDFEGYVTRTVPWGAQSGIAKVIPPEGWTRSLPPISKDSLAHVQIRDPIQQEMIGRNGLYRQINKVRNKNHPLSVKEWWDKCCDPKYVGIGPKDADRVLDRDSREAVERRKKIVEDGKKRQDEARRKRKETEARKLAKQGKATAGNEHAEPVDLDGSIAQGGSEIAPGAVDVDSKEPPALDHSSTSSHSSPDPLAVTPKADLIDPWYEEFDLRTGWLPKDTAQQDYTPEACSTMEKKFWKGVGSGEPGWYGADLQGSLFVDKDTPWNVSCLPNLLNRSKLRTRLPGVNSPYLYFGMWRAAFAWHVEDMDLFSINYIHFGAPKFWYSIPQGQAEYFERIIAGYFPKDAEACDQFLRHKSFTVSPQRLANDGIRVNMLIQEQNEFVITYPRGYHAGFNMGFNCAESINFALESWVELGKRAKACQYPKLTSARSVQINMDELLAEDDLIEAIEEERREKKSRKSVDGQTPRKRMKTVNAFDQEPMVVSEDDSDSIPREPAVRLKPHPKLIDISAQPKRAAIVKEEPSYPCILCPSLSKQDLLEVFEPNGTTIGYSRSRESGAYAHADCAESMPDLYVMDILVEGTGTTKTMVMGINDISKDRWNLKCACCPDKKSALLGSKVQCSQAKCVKAFHVSCAKANDTVVYRMWEVEEWVAQPLPPDAPAWQKPTYKSNMVLKTEILCPIHNPDMKEIKKKQALEALRFKVLALLPGSRIKVKTHGGTYEVELVRTIEDTKQVQVLVDDGRLRAVDWTHIDFRPRTETKLMANEYAGPPKRSRKSTDAPSQRTEVEPRPQPANQSRPQQANQSRPQQADRPDVQLPRVTLNPQSHPHTSSFDRTLQPRPSASSTHPPPFASTTHYPPPDSTPRYQSYPNTLPNQQKFNNHHIPTQVIMCESAGYAPSPMYGYLPPVPQHYGHQMPSVLQNYHQPPQHLPYSYPPQQYYPVLQPPHGYAPAHPPPLAYPPKNGSYYPAQMLPPLHRSHGESKSSSGTFIATTGASSQQSGGTSRSSGIASSPSGLPGIGKIDLGLDRMTALMVALSPFPIPYIHLSGTNGKGSISALLESCLRASGIRTGRYNSPHLIEARDAICINGSPPSEQDYRAALNHVENVARNHQLKPTIFEVSTAAAYVLMGQASPRVQVMIIECGMGGARDATNVLNPNFNLVSALTSVGLDHTAFLGDTVEAITREKASITVPGGVLVIAPQKYAQVVPVASQVVDSKSAKIVEARSSTEIRSPGKRQMSLSPFVNPAPTLVETPWPFGFSHPSASRSIQTRLSLWGSHQIDNLSLALSILHVLRCDPRALSILPMSSRITDGTIQRGVEATRWRGRCSWISDGRRPPLLVDGAHNKDSCETLRAYIDSLDIQPPPSRPTVFIISLSASAGKSPLDVLTPLLRRGDSVIVTEFSTPVEGMPWVKPVPKAEVADAVVHLLGAGTEVMLAGEYKEALRMVEGMQVGLTVVCGSLYLVADAYMA
ncbi:hypothetical protein P7C73_g911, partial [Tremellales sp. Uapishka_1]